MQSLRALIEQSFARNEDAVLACSALKRKYRDVLRVRSDVKFVFLRGDRARIAEQLKERGEHFFDPNVLASQFADLEEPAVSENVMTITLGDTLDEVVEQIRRKLMVDS